MGPAVILMTPRTGATGLNLQCASKVIIFEPALNPGVEQQALGRVLRIGQAEDVHIYRFVTQGTVEDAIVRRRASGNFHVGVVRDILLGLRPPPGWPPLPGQRRGGRRGETPGGRHHRHVRGAV